MEALIIPAMALLSAWGGGSLWPAHILNKKGAVDDQGKDLGGIMPFSLTWLPEAFFALGFVYALFPLIGWYALIAFPISYAGMQAATAPGLHWGKGGYNPNRTSTIKPIVDWINKHTFKVDPSTREYCWLYMGFKGFLITLPVGGAGAILWPLGYEAGERFGSNTYRELLSGGFVGLWLFAFKLGIALSSPYVLQTP